MTPRLSSPVLAAVNVRIQVWDAHTPALEEAARAGCGCLISDVWGHNRVTTVGRNRLVSLLANDGTSGLTTFAIGTGSTAAADGDTTLASSVFTAAITRFLQTTGTLTAQFYLSTSTLNGTTIREAGLLTGDTVLYARYVLVTPIAKTSAIAVTFSWENAFTLSA